MSSDRFAQYTTAIADVSDGDREEFIKYIVRCSKNDADKNKRFDDVLTKYQLNRLGLDQNSQSVTFPSSPVFENVDELAAGLIKYLFP